MHIIDCIPLKRGVGREVLSYFSKERFPVGSVVPISLRGKRTNGLVINVRSPHEARSELRSATFSLKKINGSTHRQLFTEQFINACKLTADFTATTTGAVISALIPSAIIDEQKISIKPQVNKKIDNPLSSEAYIVQVTNDEERRAHYKSIIRETFARKKSVFVCVPTRHELEPLIAQVAKGIEEYAYTIHSALSPKVLKDSWKRAISNEHPVVVIGTGQILSLPRNDIGAIIIEREHSSAYKMVSRPYVDVRRAAEALAKLCGARYIVGDNAMRIETIWRARTHELIELTPASFRSPSNAQHVRVDLRPVRRNGHMSWISEPMYQLLYETRQANRLSFIYVTRRGIAPSTVCQDCGTVVLCNNCSAPVVLHGSEQNRHFLCHRCGERRSAEERCRNCESWRLLPLGIGSEQIMNDLREIFSEAEIFQIDKDTTPTSQKAHATAQKFLHSPGSILVGTELAVGQLLQPVHTSIITSVDSLFSLPDFRIHEKIMSLALRIRSLTTGTFMLQTRMPEKSLWQHLEHGNLLDFYREEIADRERYQYPPFSVFIKFTAKGTKAEARNIMETVKEQLLPFELHVFPAFIERIRGSFILHGILQVPRTEWPNPELLAKLRTLPQYVSIQVDPDNLL